MMASKIPHWRAAADPDVLREYDAFGPWIGEVKHRADLPVGSADGGRSFRERATSSRCRDPWTVPRSAPGWTSTRR